MSDVKRPKSNPARHRVYSEDEIEAILLCSRGDVIGDMFEFALESIKNRNKSNRGVLAETADRAKTRHVSISTLDTGLGFSSNVRVLMGTN